MINFLSNWIEGIAVTVVIASIFEMILPNGNLKKYIKVILGIYVVFSIIAPFVDSKELYSIDVSKQIENYAENITNDNNSNIQNNQEKELNTIYAKTLEKEIKQAVEKQGFVVYKCTVEGNFNAEDKDAAISKINIIIESKNEKNDDTKNNTISIENIQEIEKVEIGQNNDEEDTSKILPKDISDLKKYLSQHYEIDKKVINIQVR